MRADLYWLQVDSNLSLMQRARGAAILTLLISVAHGALDVAAPMLSVLANPLNSELLITLVQLIQLSVLLSLLHLAAINACVFVVLALLRRIGWSAVGRWEPGVIVLVDFALVSAAFLGVEYYDNQLHQGMRLFSPITGYLLALAVLFMAALGLRRAVTALALRVWAWTGVAFAAVFALSLAVTYEPEIEVTARQADHPNVIYFVVDTLRASHMSLYGYERDTTPRIDTIATESAMVFDRAYVQYTASTSSHTSLYSGCYAFNHKTYKNGSSIPADVTLISERFKEAGYHTAAFHNHAFLGVDEGFGKGFDTFVETHEPRLLNTRPVVWRYELHLVRAWELLLRRETVRILVADWLDHAPEPFYLWLHTGEPHDSYKPPERLWKKFSEEDYHGEMDGQVRRSVDYASMSANDLAHMIARYDGEVAWVDEHYARLIQKLTDLGLERDTLVVLTSDHGEALGEHGHYFGHGTVYDESVRVPLIFRMPGTIPAGRIGESVEAIDIAATILRVAKIRDESHFCDGRDLSALWSEPGVSLPPAIAWKQRSVAAMDESVKLIINDYPDGERELYDLESDPHELVNLADSRPEDRIRLENVIREVCESSREALKLCLYSLGNDYGELDEAALQKLRSLGYVE